MRERIHSIVDEIEAEDQTAIEMEEYEGSSDDEQYSLPKEWKEPRVVPGLVVVPVSVDRARADVAVLPKCR